MEFTGERYVPSEEGQIKYEHLHRYALSLEFVAGKAVMDIASGEGYGAHLMASVAASVTGVDVDPNAVEHSKRSYFSPNLQFVAGSCSAVPLPNASFDVITSFETIEHHDKHEEMMSEIKRLLKPGGLLIISSPNRTTYSDEPGYTNPYHVKELYFDEFHQLLGRHFKHFRIFGQRLATGSFVFPLTATKSGSMEALTGKGSEIVHRVCSLPSPIYFVAICSDSAKVEDVEVSSVYMDQSDDLFKSLETLRVGQIRYMEAEVRETQARALRQNARSQRILALSQSQLQQTQSELARFKMDYEWLLKCAREELEQTRAEAEQARVEAEQASLEAERLLSEAHAEAWTHSQKRADRQDKAIEKFLATAKSELSGREEITNWIYSSHPWNVALKVQRWARRWNRLRDKVRPAEDVFQGALDSPATAQLISESISVSGWAFSKAAPINLVQVFIDEFYMGEVEHDLERPDIVTALSGKAPLNCGFAGSIRLGGLHVSGERTLKLRAYDTLGNKHVVTRQIFVLSQTRAEFQGYIDLPEADSLVEDYLEIRGWVFSKSGSIVLVQAFLDDICLGGLQYGLIRPDVVVALKGEASAVPLECGYHERIHLAGFQISGKAELRIRAFDEHFNHEDFRSTVTIRPPAPKTAAVVRVVSVVREEPVQIESEAASAPPNDFFRELADVIGEFQNQMDRDPSILDWSSGLGFAGAFPTLAVWSPPDSGDPASLPYLDRTIDIVVVSLTAPERLTEARRVATGAVVLASTETDIQVEWLSAASELQMPKVSIVIPVYNKVEYTRDCVEQLGKTLPHNFNGEIIVVDDASADETPAVLKQFAAADNRIKVLRNPQNVGFIASCNHGAQAASGEILVFLNNDTLPQPGWLPPLIRTLRDAPKAGAVGGKLIYPDGTLQEAGGVIFSDGSGCNFGKHDAAANAPLYSFLREVDYCSGALLATRRSLFLELGGFDSRYAPAYYEDTDYCFTLREKGHRVYYQPESAVVHFEGVSSGTDITSGVKSYQAVNRKKFVEKWSDALKQQPDPPAHYDFATLYSLSRRSGKDRL